MGKISHSPDLNAIASGDDLLQGVAQLRFGRTAEIDAAHLAESTEACRLRCRNPSGRISSSGWRSRRGRNRAKSCSMSAQESSGRCSRNAVRSSSINNRAIATKAL